MNVNENDVKDALKEKAPYLACFSHSSAKALNIFTKPTRLLAAAGDARLLWTPVLGNLLENNQPLGEAAGESRHWAADGGVERPALPVENILELVWLRKAFITMIIILFTIAQCVHWAVR